MARKKKNTLLTVGEYEKKNGRGQQTVEEYEKTNKGNFQKTLNNMLTRQKAMKAQREAQQRQQEEAQRQRDNYVWSKDDLVDNSRIIRGAISEDRHRQEKAWDDYVKNYTYDKDQLVDNSRTIRNALARQRHDTQNLLNNYTYDKDQLVDNSRKIRNSIARNNYELQRMRDNYVYSKDELADNSRLVRNQISRANYKNNKWLEEMLKGMQLSQQRQDTGYDTGHRGYEKAKSDYGTKNDSLLFNGVNHLNMDVDTYKKIVSDEEKLISQGDYDNGTNPWKMTKQGRNAFISDMNNKAGAARNKLAEMGEEYDPDMAAESKWGQIFDWIEDRDNRKLEETINGKSTHDRVRAQDKLKEKLSTVDSRRYQAIRNALDYINIYFDKDQWKDGDLELLRGVFYDTIMDDSYQERIAGMSEEDKNQLDMMIDESIKDALGIGTGMSREKWAEQKKELEKAAAAYEKSAQEAEEVNAYYDRMGEMSSWAPANMDDEYDPTLINVRQTTGRRRAKGLMGKVLEEPYYSFEIDGNETDQAYSWMNFSPDTTETTWYDIYNEPEYVHKERFATDEMRRTFNQKFKYDKENGTNTAYQYLQGIMPYLNQKMTEYTDWYLRSKADEPITGINRRVETYVTQPFAGTIGTVGSLAALLGNESAKDPNSRWYSLTKTNRITREEQNRDAAEWVDRNIGGNWGNNAEFVLSTIDSVADNLMAMGIAGGGGGKEGYKAAMRIIQWVMSSEATSNTMLSKLEAGYDPTEAAVYALGDGVIEWITERVSLETILKADVRGMLGNGRKIRAYLFKAGLAEGSEEINADLLNWGLDLVMSMANGHETELGKRYRELVTAGMDPKQASKQVLTEKFDQMKMSGLAGMLSGYALSGGRVVLNTANQFMEGKAIRDTGKANSLIDIGLQQQEGTISRENALALDQRRNQGKKIGNIETGRLFDSLMYETGEKINEQTVKTRTDNIYKDLISNNVDVQDAGRMTELIVKALDNGGIDALTDSERHEINQNQGALNTYLDYRFNEETTEKVARDTAQDTQKEIRTRMAVSNLFTNNKMPARSNTIKGRYAINENDRAYQDAEGERVSGPRGVIVYDHDTTRHGQLVGFYINNENGELKLKYTVNINNKAVQVDPDQIRTTNRGMATIIESQVNNPMFYSPEYVNQMIQDISETEAQENPWDYMIDASLIRYAAFQQNQMPQTKIPLEVADRLYKMATDEWNTARDEYSKVKNAHEAGKGSAIIGDFKYGTKEFDDAIDQLNLTKEQKNELRTAAALAVAAGADIRLVDNAYIEKLAQENKKYAEFSGKASQLYGEQNQNEILINYEGQNRGINLVTGKMEDQGQHNVMVTFAHEFVHWLQQNSREAYDNLSKYVFDTQRQTLGTQGINEALDKYMTNFGYDLAKAVDEYIAESCESIFANKDVLKHIQQTNKTLFGQIRDYVSDLIGRVKSALVRMMPSMSEAGRNMINTNMRELAKAVNLAWDEAVGNVTEEQAQVTAEEISRMSRAQLDEGYMAAVQAEDQALMRDYLDEAAKRNGYDKQIWYHGSRMFGFTEFDTDSIYLTKHSNIAKYYGYYNNNTENGVRNISDAAFNVDQLSRMSDEELFRIAKQYLGGVNGEVRNIRVNNRGMIEVETYFANFNDTTKMTYSRDNFLRNLKNSIRNAPNTPDAQGIYQFYVKPGNQYVLDVENRNFDDIRITGQQINEDTGRTRFDTHMISSWAKQNGYDSVWLKNIHVNGTDYSDYMIVFDKNNVKSADLITYDDNGEIIQPSERFNEEEGDFRFSRAYDEVVERDKSYFENILKHKDTINISYIENPLRVNVGAKGRIQVSSVLQTVRENPLVQTYHTGGNGEHYYVNVPDLHINIELPAKGIKHGFSSSTDVNTNYMNAMLAQYVPDLLQNAIEVNRGNKYTETKTNVEHILVGGVRMMLNGKMRDYAVRFTVYNQKENAPYLESMDIMADLKGIKEKETEIVSLGKKSPRAHHTSLTMKLSDFIRDVKNDMNDTFPDATYKKAGMERKQNDFSKHLRFNRAANVEESRDLIAYHNLGAEQLRAVLRLGGFAMPSIGITRSNYVNDRYGDISVLFYKNTIDPRANRANRVYGGDAWTPVYPTIEYKLDEKKIRSIMKKIDSLVPSDRQLDRVYMYLENMSKDVNGRNGNVIEAVKRYDILKQAYLADRGINIEYPMKQKSLDGFNKFDNQQVVRAYNLLGDDTIINAYEMGNTYQYLKDHPEIVNALRDEMNAYWKEQLKEKVSEGTRLKLLDKALYDENNFGASQAMSLIEAAYRYMKQGIKQEVDEYALRDLLNEKIDEADYENWLKELFSGAIEKQGLRNNKNYYTDSGNPRTWEQLHDEETLENVVKIMKSQEDKGANTFFNQSTILALGTKDYKSIDDIRKDKSRLKHISDEEMSEAKSDIVNRFGTLADDLAGNPEGSLFEQLQARDRVRDAIVDGLRTAKTAYGLKSILGEWNIKATDAQVQEIMDLMREISELPTEYFEAKPQRGVGLDEIAVVLVPEGTDQTLLNELDKAGIEWETYDGTSEDRLKKMNSHDDVRFSRWTEQGMDVNYWMEHATPSMVQTEDERALIDAYRSKRISMSLSIKKQLDYKAKIRALEAKTELTTEQKSELTALRNKLQIEQDKLARLEDEMFRITRTDGWAGAMYQHNMVFRDYIEGKTQDQVRKTVEDMLRKVEETQEQIRRDTASLKKLAEEQAVKSMESYMGKTSLGKMASMLRNYYKSSMNKGEISARLAEMALKLANGQDISAETEELARDLISKMRGVRSETLDSLKGTTLIIGQNILNQLKADNTSLKEIRSRIRGSGVTIRMEQNSRLDEQWAELRENNQALPDISDRADADKLYDIVSFIESELKASTGSEQADIDMADAALFVRSAVGNVTTYLTDDPAARAQIENLMKQVQELSRRTEKTAEQMEALDRKLDDVIQAGQRAKGMTTVLERDVNEAIKYYNTTARVAAENERNKVRKALIKQLRSETAQKLLKQAEQFRERMANDKKARELAEDNKALRRQISTVASRMANRIFAETDKQNVPEEAKALVRQVLDMLSQHDNFFRHVTFWDGQEIENVRERLRRMFATFGPFNMDEDLDWLVVKAADPADNDYTAYDKVVEDLIAIETGLMEYRNAEGQGRISLQDRKAALEKVQEALSEIWNVVQARSELFINGQKMQVFELAEIMRQQFENSRFKGERTGYGRRARNAAAGMVNWGNLTPEYFFKNLRNSAMDLLHNGLKGAENRNGLEANKAKQRVAEIAQQHGYASWDGQEVHKVKTRSGEIDMTTEQIMALYATWIRESNQMRPEDTAHLLNGGFVLAENEQNKGKPGREKKTTRPIRMNEAQLIALGSYLTDEQKAFVHDIVNYMSGELAELGNEASMRMYGIKKFTEQYYFPIKSWGGVLNRRSDAGVRNSNENRAAQQGFSKRVKNNASNAIEISDFTPTAVKHIVGMIGYNTIAPAIENMNKVLNQQLTYGEIKEGTDGEVEDDTYKRNMRAAFEEAYGKQAADYLATFMKDMNGGITTERTAFDKLLSMFKKNAVAGSLSVAAQQPLSYIRAAMEISPRYLAQAISPQYWKGSYAEMMKYSGIAVIKEMGKFDMNFGQTMTEWIQPEGMESKARKAWNGVTNAMTALPSKMDAMTWTRMWSAVKLEQMALNPDMDHSSDEFLEKVAERFNEVMRRTQVYDSVMTKSQNMRSNNFAMKGITSFMAEPTLSLNVLADAWQNVGTAGGKRRAIKALVTFLLSAAAQAGVKAFFSTGRSPDKKKTREENFMNRFIQNLLTEANPFGLIPGYNSLIKVLTKGELKDIAASVIGKAVNVYDNTLKLITEWNWSYRNIEDSVGQIFQLASDVPLKNLMRDFRAMVNFFSNGAASGFTGNEYAKRPTNWNMIKYSAWDTLMSEDFIGFINKRLGDAGYGTTAQDYYPRIYEAEKAGNQQAADEMKEYLKLNSTAQDPEKSMNDALRKLYNQDDSLTTEQKLQKAKQYGLKDTTGFILDEYRNGKISRAEAEKLYRKEKPNVKDKDLMEAFDKIDWVNDGNDGTNYSNYTPLYTAITNNKAAEIQIAVNHMMKNGYKAEDIKRQLTTKYKDAYLNATGAEKTRLMDALTKAYKAIGLTADEALKIINGWKTK